MRRNPVGRQLFAARIRRDLSKIQLAQRTGIPKVEITAIEAGTVPTAADLIEICRVLKVRLSPLFRAND
jgi:transcriptional regulator with XRE-family HTH domain